MGVEWIVALVIVGLLLIVAASKSVSTPFRWAGLIVLNVIIGAVLLFFANIAGQYAHFHIPINPVTALLTGFLRIPGLLALIAIKLYVMV